DETFTAARDDEIDEAVELQQVADGGPVRRGDELHRVLGQSLRRQRLLEDAVQGGVRVESFFAAAEDDGVAALDAQAGGIDRDVGTGFVDEEDHAERDAHLQDL